MIPDKILTSGTTMKYKGGVPQTLTSTYFIYVPFEKQDTLKDVCEKAVLLAKEQNINYLDITVKVNGIINEKNCNGENVAYYQCEMTADLDGYEYNQWIWSIRSTPATEVKTVDYEGYPTYVTKPDAVSWFGGLGGAVGVMLYRYQKQLAEMDVYVPASEIVGQRKRIISTASSESVIAHTRNWQGYTNSATFFGWAPRNVLCMGLDVEFVNKLRNNGWIIQETVRFQCKPGPGEMGEVAAFCGAPPPGFDPKDPIYQGTPGSPTMPGGWDSYVYWRDPDTGIAVPPARRIQNYPTKNFQEMLKLSVGDTM